jgi:hypothetical protein
MNFRCILAVLAATTLSGCAMNPAVGVETLNGIRTDGITTAIGQEAPYSERTKAGVITDTAMVIGTALLGHGVAGTTFASHGTPPADGYLDTGTWKSIFTPDEEDNLFTPAMAMNASVRHRLKAQGIRFDPESGYSITSTSEYWGLDYEKLTGTDDYRLYYSLNVSLRHGIFLVRGVTCTGATLEKHSYDDWVANDRSRIHQSVAAVGDSCASRLLAQLGLNAIDPQPVATTH